MNPKQAKKLGVFLRKHRETQGLSVRDLEALSGVSYVTIARFEQGAFAAPAPDKLARVAEALKLPLADVYGMAEYATPSELPAPGIYLRTKFRGLPTRQLEELTRELDRIFRRHGIEPDRPSREASSKQSPQKKGGKV